MRRCAGVSMVELMVCLVILAVVALALADGLVTSMSGTTVTEERSAALRTAEEKLQRLAGFGKLLIAPSTDPTHLDLSDWGTGAADNGVVRNFVYSNGQQEPATFPVFYEKVDSAGNGNNKALNLNRLNPGDANPLHQDVGELVVWYAEFNSGTGSPASRKDFGRDLAGGVVTGNYPAGTPDGKPDGVNFDFTTIGSDLDCDGATTTADIRASAVDCYGSNRGRVPIGALVRWRGADGREQRVEVWTLVDFTQYIPPQQ